MSEAQYKMTFRKTTQRAIYTCMLSIVACAMMLFGTTFAWFTENAESGLNTAQAVNFNVTISQTEFNTSGSHDVTLTRIGGGTSPGYCRFTLTLTGSYTDTQTVTYSDGTQGDTMNQAVDLSVTKNCYANFSDEVDQTISFRLNLTNAAASISNVTASWGSTTGDSGGVLLRGARPETVEITDGMSIDFGMEDQTSTVPASAEQEAEKLAAEEAAATAAQQAEPQTPTKDSQTITNGDNNDGGNNNDNTDPGTGNDGNGNGDSGSGTGE